MKTKLKEKKPWIKRGPLKTFSFFLGFSAMIWVVTQFSKDYTEVLEMPIVYTNLPKDKILVGDTPKTLDIRIRDRGFYIAWNRMFPQEIIIDISDAREEGKSLVYDLELQKTAILSQLDLEYENVVFLQKNIKISFEQLTIKKVAVIASIDLSFAVGYSALKEIELQPDSIRVSGAASIMDTLKTIKTKPLKIKNISNDIKGKVKLETSNLKQVSLYQNEVNYSIRTEKFTEGKVEIPIKLLNVPEGTNVVIFPKNVVIYYQVSLKDFEKIDSSSFLVAVDFKNAKDSDGFLIAQILEEPKQVNNIRLNEKKIQFVIKR